MKPRSSLKAWQITLCALALAWPLSAQQTPEEMEFPSEGSIEKLPKHIRFAADQLSLFADFAHPQGAEVRVYLINTTGEDRNFSAQNGDLYCKRQTRTGNGKWERCDTHLYSWCGNSYSSRTVPAGSYYAWEQRLSSAAGTAHPVRFHLYQRLSEELTSNEGTGLVGDGEVAFCRQDAMAMQYAPFEVVAGVATGRIQGGQGTSGDPSDVAIGNLIRFANDKRLFPLIKEIVARLPEVDPRVADSRYQSCLEVLAHAKDVSISSDECWQFLAEPIRSRTGFMVEVGLRWLINKFEFEKEKVQSLLDGVLADPRHPALYTAIYMCPQVYDKTAAGHHLSTIMRDARYYEEDRKTARRTYEQIFENPFVKIEIENGAFDEAKPAPLKSIRISNTSPQSITLDEHSLVMKVTADHASGDTDPFASATTPAAPPKNLPLRVTPFQAWFHGQPVVLKPGEAWESKNVTWWELVESSRIQGTKDLVAVFSVELPALWEIPARAPWTVSESSDRILGKITPASTSTKPLPGGVLPPPK